MKTNQFYYTVADGSSITTLDHTPNIAEIERSGFFLFQGEQREVRGIHRTPKGVQIELWKQLPRR